MNLYIATFYTHFAALGFFKKLKNRNIEARLMPVPRNVSSSCGTCVEYRHTTVIEHNDEDLEDTFLWENGKYVRS